MPSQKTGNVIGAASVGVFLICWSGIFAAPQLLRPSWVPNIWLAAFVALVCVVLASIIAGRMSSKWWYVVTGAAVLSAAILYANAAV